MLTAEITACAQLVERGDPDRFIASMAAPPAVRRVLFPLYAFNLEVSRAPWLTQEPMIGEMRLQWWRDALDEIAQGGPVRRHEVATPLASVLSAQATEPLDALILARRWDLYREPFEDEAAFTAYIEATAAGPLHAAALSLGAAPVEVLADAGFALGLANWFRAIPALEAAGRFPLPDGRPEAVRALALQGLERLARARARRAEVSPEVAPVLLSAWQAGAILRQVRDAPARVTQGQLGQSELARRGGLMLRALSGRW